MPEIIAEAGSNHNGSVERACELVEVASRAGATSVKFQFINAEGLYIPAFLDGDQYVENSVYHARKSEELSADDWRQVWHHAKGVGIDISASVFDWKGIQLLAELGSNYVKIASTDATNHELIGQACEVFDRVIISTGMASLGEIDETVSFVRGNFPSTDLRLMHCVSVYPCPLGSANVQRVRMMRDCFNCPVGYSDHTLGESAAAMALAQGASFVEKHFTTDQELPGFDHAHALGERALAEYVQIVNACDKSLARPSNISIPAEETTRIRARRGVYAARDLPEGHALTRDDIRYVRPSTDSKGSDVAAFIGGRLTSPIRRFEPLALESSPRASAGNWRAARDYWREEMTEKGMSSPDGNN